MTKQIPLTKGMVAIVDDEDYESAMTLKWCASKGYSKWYAARTHYVKGGKGKKHYHLPLHNFIMGQPEKGFYWDHINGDGLDNRRSNLRKANKSQNRGNAQKTRQIFGRPTSSKYKGVCWDKHNNKWSVQMKINNKSRHIGLFSDEKKAAEAYNKAAITHFGEFALLNDV